MLMLRQRAGAALVFFLFVAPNGLAQTASSTLQGSHPSTHQRTTVGATSAECASCVRRNLTYLASPALRGRGSGTEDEHHAAEYIAAKLKSYGLAPAAGNGSYIQVGAIQSREVTAPPVLSFDIDDASNSRVVTWAHGSEMAVYFLSQPDISGPLQKLDLTDPDTSPASVEEGAVLLLKMKPGTSLTDERAVVGPYMKSKPQMIILPESPQSVQLFGNDAKLPRLAKKVGEDDSTGPPAIVIAKEEAFDQLWGAVDGTVVKLHADTSAWKTSHTWNVLAKLQGTTEKDQIILLSAHLDHLGIRDGKLYPGADDDASGTAAVMELARALARKPKLRRTVVFALWGSEEAGMLGSQYFLKHPTFELKNLVANLEFEMIGRPDPKLHPDQLWLSGWERTDLGPALARHGAKLVGDPHPEQNFFARSDNYALARKGLIAQTVSSYGLHADYHQTTDTVSRISWLHLNRAIASMIGPVSWLADSGFAPSWNPGQKP